MSQQADIQTATKTQRHQGSQSELPDDDAKDQYPINK